MGKVHEGQGFGASLNPGSFRVKGSSMGSVQDADYGPKYDLSGSLGAPTRRAACPK